MYPLSLYGCPTMYSTMYYVPYVLCIPMYPIWMSYVPLDVLCTLYVLSMYSMYYVSYVSILCIFQQKEYQNEA